MSIILALRISTPLRAQRPWDIGRADVYGRI